LDKIGHDGVVTIEEGKGTTLEYELVEGEFAAAECTGSRCKSDADAQR
jgi:hypothetical protein